jgi:hypothetical protein
MDTVAEQLLGEVITRLARMEEAVKELCDKQATKDHYTIEEFAAKVAKAPFTCREWARHGRIKATKRHSGRGAHKEWTVSHDELLRYQHFGLLPEPSISNGRSERK